MNRSKIKVAGRDIRLEFHPYGEKPPGPTVFVVGGCDNWCSPDIFGVADTYTEAVKFIQNQCSVKGGIVQHKIVNPPKYPYGYDFVVIEEVLKV